MLAATVTWGCKKQENAPTSSTSADQGPPAMGVPVAITNAGAPVVVPGSGDTEATLNQLSLELRRYVVRTRSVPKTFEEFVAKSQAQIPPAPPGKKYAIKGQLVVLVNR